MLDLATLQAELVTRGSPWQAAPTRLSALDPAQRQRLAGAREVPLAEALEAASTAATPSRPSTAMPAARLDWRAHSGNWVTPIRDQGICRSCVAFAICAVMESRLRIDANDASLDAILAPGPLFFRGHPPGCDEGRYASDLVMEARKGVALERDAPYSADNPISAPTSAFARVTSFRYGGGDARARKFFVADNGPVYAEMRLYEDIFNHQSGVYRHIQGDNEGLHAVVIVGYDDDQSCWILKNSWGPGFHEGGFLRLAYGECEIDTRPFIALEVERVIDAPT